MVERFFCKLNTSGASQLASQARQELSGHCRLGIGSPLDALL
jgi:hypothetical protein